MAVAQIQPFACVVPAGTPSSAPAVFQMTLLALDIEWLEWEVPPGARGNVGFYFGSHGAPIIPYATGSTPWIVTDGRAVHWDLTDQPDSGDWEMRAYNVGVDPHTIYVRWGLAKPLTPISGITGSPDVTLLNS